MAAANPVERALASRIAASERWARESDRAAATAPARNAFNQRFLDMADPDGVLPLAERHRRAELLRRAHFSRLALASARARRKAAGLLAEAEAAEQEKSAGSA